MRTHNRLFIFALFVLASGVPQTAFGFWPFGGGAQAPVPVVVPPKTALEELIEQGQQFYTSHKGTLITAGVGTVSVVAILAYLNRDRLREAFASREKEHETSEKNQETILKTLVKQIPQLAVVGGVGAYAYKNDLDKVFMKLARHHPFATGCVTGISVTAWLALMYLKNALMHNTRAMEAIKVNKERGELLSAISFGLTTHAPITELKGFLSELNDDAINRAVQTYEANPNDESYYLVSSLVLAKMIGNNQS